MTENSLQPHHADPPPVNDPDDPAHDIDRLPPGAGDVFVHGYDRYQDGKYVWVNSYWRRHPDDHPGMTKKQKDALLKYLEEHRERWSKALDFSNGEMEADKQAAQDAPTQSEREADEKLSEGAHHRAEIAQQAIDDFDSRIREVKAVRPKK